MALSTERIFMAPVSAIGAAAPVMAGGQDLPSTMQDKVVSYFSGYFRSAARKERLQSRHRPGIHLQGHRGEDRRHRHPPKGTLLTLSAQEASKLINGKPVLASGIADSLPDLLAKAGLNGAIHRDRAYGIRDAGILAYDAFAAAAAGRDPWRLYRAEGRRIRRRPDSSRAFVSCCFSSAVTLRGSPGGRWPFSLQSGLSLIVSEIAIHPGTIIPGLIGLLLVGAAVIWAMVDRYPHEPLIPTGACSSGR